MWRRPRLASAIALATAASWSCAGDATGPDAAACGAETPAVAATVGTGATVTFDWSPRCPVALLLVEELSGSDVWWVSTPDRANRIAPRITYGQVPSGMDGPSPATPLVAGRSYVLALWRVLPPGSTVRCQQNLENACLVASRTFTP